MSQRPSRARRAAPFGPLVLALVALAGPARAATRVRVVAANVASGRSLRYEEAGLRILEALQGDIYLLQRFRVGGDDEGSVRELARRVLGGKGYFYREPEDALGASPSAILSRYPILESGEWRDVEVSDRDYVWALIDVPGRRHLLAISLNFKAGDLIEDRRRRRREATRLVRMLRISRAARHWLLLGGSIHNRSRDEEALEELASVVVTEGPWPADGAGDEGTTVDRQGAQDWILADEDLDGREAAVVIEEQRFPGGLVFDSRRFRPLRSVRPVRSGDSAVAGLTHLPVIRDFMLGGGPEP